MIKRFENKTVLVTGASRGLGRAISIDFAKEGANLILIARNIDNLTALKNEIVSKFNVSVDIYSLDLNNTRDIENTFDTFNNNNIKLDYLINNAGFLKPESIDEQTISTINKTINTNILAPLLCSKLAIPLFKRSKSTDKAIINISSLSGIPHIEKFPNMTSYIASKHALNGITEGLSVEFKEKDIRVNAIAPGAINTDMLNSLFPEYDSKTKAEDISPIVLQLCDPSLSKHMSGSIIPIHCN